MRISQAFKMAFSAVWGNKVRSFLTMLGVIIGVLAVSLLITLGQGGREEIAKQINSLGSDLVVAQVSAQRDYDVPLEQVRALRRLDRAGAGALLRFRRRKERYLPPQYGGPSPLGGLAAPELTGNDLRWKLRFDRMLAANAALYEELLGGLSLDGCPPRYGVPVILTAGERDWTTPYPLAAAYYDTLSAPCKVFLSLPDAGHLPFRERPEEWSHILLDALAQI